MNVDMRTSTQNAYLCHSDYVQAIVGKFVRRYGGDWEDLLAEANLLFCRAHYQYMAGCRPSGKPVTGTYTQIVYSWLWMGLLDKYRPQVEARKRATVVQGEAVYTVADKPFDVVRWSLDLSDDAQCVLDLVMDTPRVLQEAINTKGGTPRNIRSAVREALYGAGWSRCRVNTTFKEIKEAL